MLEYDVNKAFYLNCEIIYDPWVRGSGPRPGLIGPYCENVFNLKIYSSLLQYIIEKTKLHSYDVHEGPYQKSKNHGPWM